VIGKTISHYRIVKEVGRGGMGVVYKAEDTRLERFVAIKVLPRQVAAQPEERERFEREARAAAALNHRNIATVHAIEEVEDDVFIVMEFVEGEELKQRVSRGRLPVAEAVDIAAQIARGLHAAHRKGIVHRDIKSGNIMLSTEGEVKVMDFGLAKFRGGSQVTKVGTTVGTAAYMSPEQARGEEVDQRSDIWSFGIVLYEMLTGKPPFKSDYEQAVVYSILNEQPESLLQARPDVPDEVHAVVKKLLQKDPGDRYQSMGEVVEALGGKRGEPISGDQVQAGKPVPDARSEAASRGMTKPVTIGMMLGLALAIVVAGWFLVSRVMKDGGGDQYLTDPDKRTVGVIGFENLSDPEDSEHLSRMMMGLITTDLAESGGLRVVSMAKVLDAIRKVQGASGGRFDASIASEAARLAGAKVMLVGQVLQSDERLLLTAELVDVESGDALGTLKKDVGSKAEMFSLAEAIAEEVRRSLRAGDDQGAHPTGDLARSLTSSPDAYRQFVVGEMAFHQLRFVEAAERFSLAVKLDSSFALAHYRLAWAYSWMGQDLGGMNVLNEGLPYVNRLPKRWQTVYEAFMLLALEKPDEIRRGYDMLNALVQSGEELPDAFNMLGEIAMHNSGYWDPKRSREWFGKALDLDPTFRVVALHLQQCNVYADDLGSAEQLVSQLKEETPNDPTVLYVEILLLLAQGKAELALPLAEQLHSKDSQSGAIVSDCFMRAGQWERAEVILTRYVGEDKGYMKGRALKGRALARLGQGRFRDALEDLLEAPRHIEGQEFRFMLAGTLLTLAEVYEDVGDIESAVTVAGRAKEEDPDGAWTHYWHGHLLLAAGRTDKAEEVLSGMSDLEERVVSPAAGFWRLLLSAEVLLSRGETEKALREMEEARTIPPEYRERTAEAIVLSDVLKARGDLTGAMAALRKVVSPSRLLIQSPWDGIGTFHLSTIGTWYELARLEEETGDLDAARKHYQKFLEYWGNADITVPSVEEAKARLARLVG
jgi:tetratricopeptide (TPR) repeat protein/predicted Ser/Thr protein kinase